MKNQYAQIVFLDTQLLKIFGIHSISDYETIINHQDLQNDEHLLEKINALLSTLKKVYPIKNFNLHKTKNKVLTHNQAFNILIQCMKISMVPYVIWTEQHDRVTVKYLRLEKQNTLLYSYINKTAELRSNDVKQDCEMMTYDDMCKGIKCRVDNEYEFPINSKTFDFSMGLMSNDPQPQTNEFSHKCFERIIPSLSGVPKEDMDDMIFEIYIVNDSKSKTFVHSGRFWENDNMLQKNTFIAMALCPKTKIELRINIKRIPLNSTLRLKTTEILFKKSILKKALQSKVIIPCEPKDKLIYYNGELFEEHEYDDSFGDDIIMDYIKQSTDNSSIVKKSGLRIMYLKNNIGETIQSASSDIWKFLETKQLDLFGAKLCWYAADLFKDPDTSKHTYVKNDKYIFTYALTSSCDLETNIEVELTNGVDATVSIVYGNLTTLVTFTKDGNKYKSNELNDESFIDVLNSLMLESGVTMYLYITSPKTTDKFDNNFFGKINISSDKYYCSTELRQRLAQRGCKDSFITLNELSKLSRT